MVEKAEEIMEGAAAEAKEMQEGGPRPQVTSLVAAAVMLRLEAASNHFALPSLSEYV